MMRPLILLTLLLISACSPEPKPIQYGQDTCAHCRMVITDQRYGTELVTSKGKTYTFDSIECLAAYVQEHKDEVQSLWVTDFQHPSGLMPVEKAFFLHSDELRSPMGLNLTAFGDQITPASVLNSFRGSVLSWDEVVALVGKEWPGGRRAMPNAMHHGMAP